MIFEYDKIPKQIKESATWIKASIKDGDNPCIIIEEARMRQLAEAYSILVKQRGESSKRAELMWNYVNRIMGGKANESATL